MGMGEPMMNYKNVVDAIRKIYQEDGLECLTKNYRFYILEFQKMKMLADENLKVKLSAFITLYNKA